MRYIAAVVLSVLALVAPAAVAAPLPGDRLVAADPGAGNVNAYGDVLVWSHRAGSRRHHLYLYASGAAQQARVRPSREPLDPDLGPGPDGAPVAVYRACRPNCRLYTYSVTTGRESRLPTRMPLSCDPDWPAVWGGAVVFSVFGRRCPHTPGVWVYGGRRARLVVRAGLAGEMDLRGDRVAWIDYGNVVNRVKLGRLGKGAPVVTVFADAERCCDSNVIISGPQFGSDGLLYWSDWNDRPGPDHHRLYRGPGTWRGTCEASKTEFPSGIRSIADRLPWIDFAISGGRLFYVIPGGIYEHAGTIFDTRYSKYVRDSRNGPYCGP